MRRQRRRYSWQAYALMWAGITLVLVLFDVLLDHIDGRPLNWATTIPLAVLIPSGSIAGMIFGSRQNNRH